MKNIIDRIFSIFGKYFAVICAVSLACNVALVCLVIYQQQFVADAEQRIVNVRSAKSTVETNLEALKTDLSAQQGQTDVAEDTITRLSAENAALQDKAAELTARVDYLESLLDEQHEINDDMRINLTVYITESGEKYHKYGCPYLQNGSIPVSLDYAETEGFAPCEYCMP